MSDADFDAKPHVMLVGQYSVGKTSFIRYILGQDFPGQRIGPEPTTDRFTVVFDGPVDRIIPGNALAVSNDLPYRGLEKFGMAFLNKFEGSQVPSKVLQYISLIDTPGVLSGQKQTLNRGYNFKDVCSWFAVRSDLIILLFDAHKLDISDEFRNVMAGLKGNEDKIRCILNKADQMDKSELIRSYGALLWSLGKILGTPEVLKVYIGSFWSEPLQHEENKALFEVEESTLMRDIGDLPKNR
jgi:GTPase SAR1 family protein